MSLSYGFCLDELSSLYNSAQFSDAVHAVTGDGITIQGAQLDAAVNGFTVTVKSGYAIAAGRWLENDEPLSMTLKGSGNSEDRTDALAVRVDYEARKAELTVLENINPEEIRENPSILRNDEEYSIVLYFVRVRRGVTALTPEDLIDLRTDAKLCGKIIPLSSVTGDALYVYQYLRSGLDEKVSALVRLSNAILEAVTAKVQEILNKADEKIEDLDAQIQIIGNEPQVGELRTARLAPSPESEWLLCSGGPVPPEYSALSALLNGTLPDISKADDRYRTYIYAGS